MFFYLLSYFYNVYNVNNYTLNKVIKCVRKQFVSVIARLTISKANNDDAIQTDKH